MKRERALKGRARGGGIAILRRFALGELIGSAGRLVSRL
jgi:hypothetical protein